MRKRCRIAALALAAAWSAGCSSHLVFLESSHFGLKASFEPNNPTPAEVDIGWRRAMFAMVPQKSKDQSVEASAGSVTVTKSRAGNTQIAIVPDPNELMSMYTVFRGNIGFNDPIEIHHFLATGVAASNLLANENDLRNLVDSLKEKAAVPMTPAGGQDGGPQ